MILVFHDIGYGDLYSIPPEMFRDVLYYIKENLKFNNLNGDNFEEGVTITFDDGYYGVYRYGFKIMMDLNVKAILFPVVNAIGKRSFWDRSYGFEKRIVSWNDIKEMVSFGFKVGSHTLTHRYLPSLDDREMFKELKESREILEDKLGIGVDRVAYPYYGFSYMVYRNAILSGYRTGFGGMKGRGRMNVRRIPIYSMLKMKDIRGILNGRIPSLLKILYKISEINPKFKMLIEGYKLSSGHH